MATSIARLAVDFVARTASFSKGTKKAQSDLHRFSASVKSSSASLLKWGGALLGVATGGGLGVLITQQSEAIDVMSKFSKQTGIATEELSAFTMAADLSGVDSESLNKGVTKLAIALGKVRQGIKGADEPFLRIGLNAQKLADAPLGQAMGVIADRMNQIKSPAVKAAAAVAIFGKSGATLLPFLAEGSKGFAAAAKEAKAFGLSFTGIDGTKVEAMNDAWTRTMNLLKGIGRQIAIAISPAVEAALKQFTDWASSSGDMGATVAKWVRKTVEWIDYLANRVMLFYRFTQWGLSSWFATLTLAAEQFVKLAKQAGNGVASLIDGAIEAANAMRKLFGMDAITFRMPRFDTDVDFGGKQMAEDAKDQVKMFNELKKSKSVGLLGWYDKVTKAANEAAAAAKPKGGLLDPEDMDLVEDKLKKEKKGLKGVSDAAKEARRSFGDFKQGSLATVARGIGGGTSGGRMGGRSGNGGPGPIINLDAYRGGQNATGSRIALRGPTLSAAPSGRGDPYRPGVSRGVMSASFGDSRQGYGTGDGVRQVEILQQLLNEFRAAWRQPGARRGAVAG